MSMLKGLEYRFYLLFVMLSAGTVKAQPSGILPEDGVYEKIASGDLELKDIPGIILHWIDYLTYIAGTICVIMIIVAGFQYMTGSVVDDKERGKKTFLNAMLGLVVTFFAWVIVNTLQVFLTS